MPLFALSRPVCIAVHHCSSPGLLAQTCAWLDELSAGMQALGLPHARQADPFADWWSQRGGDVKEEAGDAMLRAHAQPFAAVAWQGLAVQALAGWQAWCDAPESLRLAGAPDKGGRGHQGPPILLLDQTPLALAAHDAHGPPALSVAPSQVVNIWVAPPGRAQASVEARIRLALVQSRQSFAAVQLGGRHATAQALSAIQHALEAGSHQGHASSSPRWRWVCERCDDGECEHLSGT